MLLKIMARGKVGRGAILDSPMKARGLLPVIQSQGCLLELTHQAKEAKLLRLGSSFSSTNLPYCPDLRAHWRPSWAHKPRQKRVATEGIPQTPAHGFSRNAYKFSLPV